MAIPRKGLGAKGRGLDALISQQIEEPTNSVIEIDINKISPNREQPRRIFDEEALEELAASIKEVGIIQPIILEKDGDYYKIIAGERRWRAAKIAGIEKIPSIIKIFDNTFSVALIENLQRENLNAMEESCGYKRLMEELTLTQEEVSEKVGKSRSAVANSLRLLNLDPQVQKLVWDNKITGGHARALLALEDKTAQMKIAEKIVENALSVRATESLVKAYNSSKNEKTPQLLFNTNPYKSIEKNLKDVFGTKVKLSCKKNKGKIEIEYYSDADLERILELINKMEN